MSYEFSYVDGDQYQPNLLDTKRGIVWMLLGP